MGEKAEILKIRMKDYLSNFNGKRVFFREQHAVNDSFFVGDKTHSISTTEDFQIEPSLKPYADLFFDKTRYSAFFGTNLDSFYSREKIDSVTLIGIETHTSILFTAEELRNRGASVTIVEPCTASRDDYLHASAISLMINYLGIRIGS